MTLPAFDFDLLGGTGLSPAHVQPFIDYVNLVYQEVNANAGNLASRTLEPVADLAALKAISGDDLLDKAVVHCETLGLYRYDAESTAAGNNVGVVVPTAVGVGAGRFLRIALPTDQRPEIHAPISGLTALKAIPASERFDGQVIFVFPFAPGEPSGLFVFIADATETGNDFSIVEPAAGTGRWFMALYPEATGTVGGAYSTKAILTALPANQRFDHGQYHAMDTGIYWFFEAATNAVFDPWVLAPDDVTPPAPGRYILVAPWNLLSLLNEKTPQTAHHGQVADVAALRAIPESERAMGTRIQLPTGYYFFISGFSGVDDGNFIVVPDVGTGVWMLGQNTAGPIIVADLAALAAIPEAWRLQPTQVFVPDKGLYWFDAASTATPGDDDTVQPAVGTGRWLRLIPTGYVQILLANFALLGARQTVKGQALNAAPPPTEVEGDKYLLFVNGVQHADWDGVTPDAVVRFNGTTWENWPKDGSSHGDSVYDDAADQIWYVNSVGNWTLGATAEADFAAAPQGNDRLYGATAPGADATLADVNVLVTSGNTQVPAAGDLCYECDAYVTATGAWVGQLVVGTDVAAALVDDTGIRLTIKQAAGNQAANTLRLRIRKVV